MSKLENVARFENGVVITLKEILDDLYEFVKSYPSVAWIEVYGVDITS